MENQLEVEKLDDVQLALYLGFVNNRGYGIKVQLDTADSYYEWMKSKRREQTEENAKQIKDLLKD